MGKIVHFMLHIFTTIFKNCIVVGKGHEAHMFLGTLAWHPWRVISSSSLHRKVISDLPDFFQVRPGLQSPCFSISPFLSFPSPTWRVLDFPYQAVLPLQHDGTQDQAQAELWVREAGCLDTSASRCRTSFSHRLGKVGCNGEYQGLAVRPTWIWILPLTLLHLTEFQFLPWTTRLMWVK